MASRVKGFLSREGKSTEHKQNDVRLVQMQQINESLVNFYMQYEAKIHVLDLPYRGTLKAEDLDPAHLLKDILRSFEHHLERHLGLFRSSGTGTGTEDTADSANQRHDQAQLTLQQIRHSVLVHFEETQPDAIDQSDTSPTKLVHQLIKQHVRLTHFQDLEHKIAGLEENIRGEKRVLAEAENTINKQEGRIDALNVVLRDNRAAHNEELQICRSQHLVEYQAVERQMREMTGKLESERESHNASRTAHQSEMQSMRSEIENYYKAKIDKDRARAKTIFEEQELNFRATVDSLKTEKTKLESSHQDELRGVIYSLDQEKGKMEKRYSDDRKALVQSHESQLKSMRVTLVTSSDLTQPLTDSELKGHFTELNNAVGALARAPFWTKPAPDPTVLGDTTGYPEVILNLPTRYHKHLLENAIWSILLESILMAPLGLQATGKVGHSLTDLWSTLFSSCNGDHTLYHVRIADQY